MSEGKNVTAVEQELGAELVDEDVDEAFVRRALDEADLNALRMALYQVTADPELAAMKLKVLKVRGGSTTQVMVDDSELERLKDKAVAYLLSGNAKSFDVRPPEDEELRAMMELLTGEELADRDFAYRRDIAAFDEFPRSAAWTDGKPEIPEGYHVAITGAGVGGIVAAIQFERLGIPYTVYERREDIGGTWHINKYPDVRVDTTNFVYQYSFEKNYPWDEYFSRAPAVKSYLEHVARKYGVYDNIRFNSDMTDATFNAETGSWELRIVAGGEVEAVAANVVVSAAGLFATPNKPQFKGAEHFKGEIVHTAEWTGDEILEGRKVAIIGNGSTGVQLLSSIAKRAAHVTVLQRTPQWISPRERYGSPISRETRWLLDTMPHYWNWYIYSMLSMGLGTQKLQEPDEQWQRDGGLISEPNDLFRAMLTEYIAQQVDGRQDLIEALTPKHAPFARRLIVDNNWYQSLLSDNVELVTAGVDHLTPNGFVSTDGSEHEADVIVLATGFSVSKYLSPAVYTNAEGKTLEQQWDEFGGGPRAYLSVTVPNFPNLFMLYGPNSQTRSGSLMSWFEIWTRYTANTVVHMLEHGHKSAAVRQDVFEQYNRDLDAASEQLVWVDKDSREKNYYVNEFGRQQVGAPWRVEDYYAYLEKLRPEDYDFA